MKLDRTKILTLDEIELVTADLRRRARRAPGTLQTLALWHLSVSYGLRNQEIGGLTLKDVRLAGGAPHISVKTLKKPRKNGRQHRPRRTVLLNWSAAYRSADGRSAADDIALWHAARIAQNARPGDPFICTLTQLPPRSPDVAGGLGPRGDAPGRPLGAAAIWRKFKSACRPLGAERVACVTCHHGRHTAATMALLAGYSLQFTADALGHSSIAVTNTYAHLIADMERPVSNIYDSARAARSDPA